MKNFSRHLNMILICAILSSLFFTWLGPMVLRLLFTPPVSFGVNCEPAAAYAMSKLVWTQLIGLGIGGLAGLAIAATRGGGATPPPTSSGV